MVNSLPKLDPEGLYSPKETWTVLGIGRSTLYKYDRSGFIAHETRPENGRRVYRGKSIMKLHAGEAIVPTVRRH